jgi:methylated-DNA-[protein]-cysteine S-methyltransferase
MHSDNAFQLETKIGRILIHWNESGQLARMDWSVDESPTAPAQQSFPFLPPAIDTFVRSMHEYFEEGKPVPSIDWQKIDVSGWTEFQRAVYQATAEIPHGETRTYAWVAARVRKFGANRAVGQALRRNPLPIIIPCHRVISALSIGGFMGCMDPNDPELKLKRQLISIEEEYLSPVFPFLRETA